MVDLRKNEPRHKTKTPPEGQIRNMGWINPSRDRNELKASPYQYALTQGQRNVVNPPYKRELYSQGRKSKGPHYHLPARKRNFQRTLMMARKGCSEITGDT